MTDCEMTGDCSLSLVEIQVLIMHNGNDLLTGTCISMYLLSKHQQFFQYLKDEERVNIYIFHIITCILCSSHLSPELVCLIQAVTSQNVFKTIERVTTIVSSLVCWDRIKTTGFEKWYF